MKVNLRVVFNDKKEVDVQATARDLVAFEDKFTKSVASIETNFMITDMLWIAWHWMKRKELTSKDFEDWCDDVDSIESSEESPK